MISTEEYRRAFGQYLRNGTPIRLSKKADRQTESYVWRTMQDAKVRTDHRYNDGRIFRWDDPDMFHPGEDYGCRCRAIPYVEGETEFAEHDLQGLAAPGAYWSISDFIRHFYLGEGRAVTLEEIGHLRAIAEHYSYSSEPPEDSPDQEHGAFRRQSNQIAREARGTGEGPLQYDFNGSYDFGDVEFPHGDAKVAGLFLGFVKSDGEMLTVSGSATYRFTDTFTDPLDLRETISQNLPIWLTDVDGTAFDIAGHWTSSFNAAFFTDKSKSVYGADEQAQ